MSADLRDTLALETFQRALDLYRNHGEEALLKLQKQIEDSIKRFEEIRRRCLGKLDDAENEACIASSRLLECQLEEDGDCRYYEQLYDEAVDMARTARLHVEIAEGHLKRMQVHLPKVQFQMHKMLFMLGIHGDTADMTIRRIIGGAASYLEVPPAYEPPSINPNVHSNEALAHNTTAISTEQDRNFSFPPLKTFLFDDSRAVATIENQPSGAYIQSFVTGLPGHTFSTDNSHDTKLHFRANGARIVKFTLSGDRSSTKADLERLQNLEVLAFSNNAPKISGCFPVQAQAFWAANGYQIANGEQEGTIEVSKSRNLLMAGFFAGNVIPKAQNPDFDQIQSKARAAHEAMLATPTDKTKKMGPTSHEYGIDPTKIWIDPIDDWDEFFRHHGNSKETYEIRSKRIMIAKQSIVQGVDYESLETQLKEDLDASQSRCSEPIMLTKFRGYYYLLDGRHRVYFARQYGYSIGAHVSEYIDIP